MTAQTAPENRSTILGIIRAFGEEIMGYEVLPENEARLAYEFMHGHGEPNLDTERNVPYRTTLAGSSQLAWFWLSAEQVGPMLYQCQRRGWSVSFPMKGHCVVGDSLSHQTDIALGLAEAMVSEARRLKA